MEYEYLINGACIGFLMAGVIVLLGAMTGKRIVMHALITMCVFFTLMGMAVAQLISSL